MSLHADYIIALKWMAMTRISNLRLVLDECHRQSSPSGWALGWLGQVAMHYPQPSKSARTSKPSWCPKMGVLWLMRGLCKSRNHVEVSVSRMCFLWNHTLPCPTSRISRTLLHICIVNRQWPPTNLQRLKITEAQTIGGNKQQMENPIMGWCLPDFPLSGFRVFFSVAGKAQSVHVLFVKDWFWNSGKYVPVWVASLQSWESRAAIMLALSTHHIGAAKPFRLI